VVAYALAGTVQIDFVSDSIGTDEEYAPVYLKDTWLSNIEVSAIVQDTVKTEIFAQRYQEVFNGPLLRGRTLR